MIYQSVLTLAPLRVSLAGGGTDFASYYSKFGGMVVSIAINKYVYVHIKRHSSLFQEKYRISYSSTEHCQTRDEIKNLIVKSSLELLRIDEPLQISISADLPSNSGLGSSSSFTVALLLGLHTLKGEKVSAAQIAREACEVEIDFMKSPIGKQDQYASSFGGFNSFEFLEDNTVKIQPIDISKELLNTIFDNSLIIWTGRGREANYILRDQENRLKDNLDHIHKLKEIAYKFKQELKSDIININILGNLVNQSWDLKKRLSPLIFDESIDGVANKIITQEPIGIKLLGAGGGGFFFAMFKKVNREIKKNLQNLVYFTPDIDFEGARVISVN
jgi:D-glycero-alpha-D-manno-heptose-7-phosphate kinase